MLGGGEEAAGESQAKPQRGLSLTPLGLSLHPWELTGAQQPGT